MFELDGLKSGPILVGEIPSAGDGGWLRVVSPAIEERIARYSSGEIRFNLMAIVKNRRWGTRVMSVFLCIIRLFCRIYFFFWRSLMLVALTSSADKYLLSRAHHANMGVWRHPLRHRLPEDTEIGSLSVSAAISHQDYRSSNVETFKQEHTFHRFYLACSSILDGMLGLSFGEIYSEIPQQEKQVMKSNVHLMSRP